MPALPVNIQRLPEEKLREVRSALRVLKANGITNLADVDELIATLESRLVGGVATPARQNGEPSTPSSPSSPLRKSFAPVPPSTQRSQGQHHRTMLVKTNEDVFFKRLFQYKEAKEGFDNLWAKISDNELESVEKLMKIESFPNHKCLFQVTKSGIEACSYDSLAEVGQAAVKKIKPMVYTLCQSIGLREDQVMIPRDEKTKEVILKSRERTEQKVAHEYDGRYACVLDLVRASIKCESAQQVVEVWEKLQSFDGVEVIRCKNRFRDALFTGYRDMLLNLKIDIPEFSDCHHIVELQVHHDKILDAKASAHTIYEFFRVYFHGNNAAVNDRLGKLMELVKTKATCLGTLLDETLECGDLDRILALQSLLATMARYELAEKLGRKALELSEKSNGEDALATLAIVSDLGGFLQAAGDLKNAKPLYERALHGYEQTMGFDDAETLSANNNLAGVLKAEGNLIAAEKLYRRALGGQERTLGADFADTLGTVNNLALLLQDQGKLDEATPLFLRAIEGREKTLGAEHPDTLTSVNNLAGLYQAQGAFEKAAPLYERAHEGREKNLGPEHPDTLSSVNNLAMLMQDQGDFFKAAPLLRRAVEGFEKAMGADHPNTLSGMNNLAGLLQEQGNLDEALALYKKVLEARERKFGPDHTDTLTSVNNLAELLYDQGKLHEAQPLYRRALDGREKACGEDHPDTLDSVNNLAVCLKASGDLDAAAPLYKRALAGSENRLGKDHPDTLSSVNNLAAFLYAKGEYAEAEPYFKRAVEGREHTLGRDHPDTLTSLKNLGVLLQKLGRKDEAQALLERVQAARHKA